MKSRVTLNRFSGPKIVQPQLNQKLQPMSPSQEVPVLSISSENTNQIIKSHLPIQTPRSEMDQNRPLLHSVSSLIFDLSNVLFFDVEPKLSLDLPNFHDELKNKFRQCSQICDFHNTEHLENYIPKKTEILQNIHDCITQIDFVGNMDESDYHALYECFSKNVIRVPLNPPDVWFAPIAIDFSIDKVEELGWEHMSIVYDIFIDFCSNRCFNSSYCPKVTAKLSDCIVNLFKTPDNRERAKLTKLLHVFYKTFHKLRADIRQSLSTFLRDFVYNPSIGCQEILTALVPIIAGFKTPLHPDNVYLLKEIILPLHSSFRLPFFINGFINVVVAYLNKNPALVQMVLDSLFEFWPLTSPPKTVLFFNELEQILPFVQANPQITKQIFEKMSQCIVDSSFAISERALMMWESDALMNLIASDTQFSFTILVPAIFQTATSHWCEDVKVFAMNALQVMKGLDPVMFDSIGTKLKTFESNRIVNEIDRGTKWADFICMIVDDPKSKSELLGKLSKIYIGCECLSPTRRSSTSLGISNHINTARELPSTLSSKNYATQIPKAPSLSEKRFARSNPNRSAVGKSMPSSGRFRTPISTLLH